MDIVIVTASGSRDYVGACLQSLSVTPFTLGPQHAWVVDNHSGDDTGQIVAQYREAVWLPQHRNLGFGAANNLGLRQGDAQLVLFLNPDTEVHPGTLDACAQRLLGDQRLGIVGCRQVDPAGVSDPNSRRTFPSLGAAASRLSGWDRVAGPSEYHTPSMAEEDCGVVDAVSGAFMMVRRDVALQLHGFDEGFWMYGEDLDLCRRARDLSFLTWYEGSVSVLHVGGVSAGRVRKLRSNLAFHHAMARFYRKHHAGSRPWVDAAVYSVIAIRLVASTLANVVRRIFVR